MLKHVQVEGTYSDHMHERGGSRERAATRVCCEYTQHSTEEEKEKEKGEKREKGESEKKESNVPVHIASTRVRKSRALSIYDHNPEHEEQ